MIEDACSLCGEIDGDDGCELEHVAGVGLVCSDCFEREFNPPYSDRIEPWT